MAVAGRYADISEGAAGGGGDGGWRVMAVGRALKIGQDRGLLKINLFIGSTMLSRLGLPVLMLSLILGVLAQWGCGGGSGSSAPAPVAPSIAQQPAPLTVNQGASASLSVGATGAAPLAFQWKKDGAVLAGATAATWTIPSAQAVDAGSYSVTVSNSVGSITSTSATLTVVVPPVITTQPTGMTLNQGQPFSLTVVATGSAPLSYQWKKGGSPVAGATSDRLSIPAVQPVDGGDYTVEVSNAAGAVTSLPAALVVLVPPTITTQPVNMTVNQGQPASFSVVAMGSAPLSYQWKKNGLAVAGATASIFPILATHSGDMGSYSVDVSNSVATVSSIAAALVVVIPPAITSQPLGATVNERQPASFQVVASGSSPMLYQWRRDGAILAGATASILNLASVLPVDAGSYTVDVSNSAGFTTSQPAVLVVNPLPIIKRFNIMPSVIPLGGGGVLEWEVSGATSLSINHGVGPLGGLTGTSNVGPLETTTYTLTATNSAGPTTADATLTVDLTPFELTNFSASPALVDFGQSTNLHWNYLGLPLALSLDGTPMSGFSAPVTPVRRQSYELQGSNQGGTDRRTLKVAARGIDLVAGNVRGSGSQDGVGPDAWFNNPSGVAVDPEGTVYVADTNNHTIRKVDSGGRVSTFAGAAGPGYWKDGVGVAAHFQYPKGVALDASGNVYIADMGNSSIRKITPLGVVTTLAGTPGFSGADDGPGSVARFNQPNALVVDPVGNVIVVDTGNQTIRMVTPLGVVSTFAGTPGLTGSGDGPVVSATFNSPSGVAIDGNGTIYVADSGNHVIRKITPAGVVSTVAGLAGVPGVTDGLAAVARFRNPTGIVADALGNLYVSDSSNYTIRKITVSGQVSTLVGAPGFRGAVDGSGGVARFDYPQGVALDSGGSLYVADFFNHVVRRITPDALVSTLAGSPEQRGATEGTGDQARFYYPYGLAVDPAGNIYVADSVNYKVRLISPGATVRTLAGRGVFGNADGNATTATFVSPTGITIDGLGNVFVSDQGDQTIRKISPVGDVSTFAGSHGVAGFADGLGLTAQFNSPHGVAADALGNVYVADYFNHAIRKITTTGAVSTLAGTVGVRGYKDGQGSEAQFGYPMGIGVDAAGNVYVADSANSVIRKITPAGLVSTLAGYPQGAGTLDGVGSAALFWFPRGLAVTAGGTVFVADTNNQTIRKITSDGTVTTVAGQVNRSAMNPGPLPGLLVDPQWIAVTPDGDLVVVCHNGIVQITAP